MNLSHSENKHFHSRHLTYFILFFCSLYCFSSYGQGRFYMYTDKEVIGDQQETDFRVVNFDSLLSLQFSLQWDETAIQLDSIVADVPFNGEFVYNQTVAEQGYTIIVWNELGLNPRSYPDSSAFFTAYFTVLDSNKSGNVCISNSPRVMEASRSLMNNGNARIPFYSDCEQNLKTDYLITGKITNDVNKDCISDASEDGIRDWTVKLEGIKSYFARTSRNGNYSIYVDSGDYTLILKKPNIDEWALCEDSIAISTTSIGTQVKDISVQYLPNCPKLEVDVSTRFIRRCFDNQYYVRYCNISGLEATDAYVEVTLDPLSDYVRSSIPFDAVDGKTYTFNIGTLAPGECGKFTITSILDCDATELGQTHCVEAHIFPDTICEPLPSWNEASILVEGTCDDNEVTFTITNVGNGNMDQPLTYIVIEDVIMYRQDNFQLDAGESLPPISLPANGSTYRIEVEQVDNHPGLSMPSFALEGCGENIMGGFTKGIIPEFPQDDANTFIDIDCQASRGSYDPNDKQGFPLGYGPEHYVYPETDIEYMIRFQNTGTDTAFKVVIRDTLSAFLDRSTLIPGNSSHIYDFEIFGENEIQFTFDNIMLPDSNVNEPASNGFVQFKIAHIESIELGTQIFNQAGIYFDFNDPIITNQTLHTVDENFLPVNTFEVENQVVHLNVYPNPFNHQTIFEVDGYEFSNLQLSVFDAMGRLVRTESFGGQPILRFDREELNPGLYIFQLSENTQILSHGKLMVQ